MPNVLDTGILHQDIVSLLYEIVCCTRQFLSSTLKSKPILVISEVSHDVLRLASLVTPPAGYSVLLKLYREVEAKFVRSGVGLPYALITQSPPGSPDFKI